MEIAKMPHYYEWIKKVWYLYTMEFYLAINMNENLSFAGKCIELENIFLSDITQVQKAKAACFLSYVDYRPNTNTAIL
jgi:hypothetical protein